MTANIDVLFGQLKLLGLGLGVNSRFSTRAQNDVAALAELYADGIDVLDDEELFAILYEHFLPEMPYGVAKARDGDPYQWLADKLELLASKSA